MKTKLNPLLLIGLIGSFTLGSNLIIQLYRAFDSHQNIWWTPKSMMLSIEESQNVFRLYINDKRLQHHLADGTLHIRNAKGEHYRIMLKDIGVRVNNWYKTKASILANALISGFLFGVSVCLLVVGLVFRNRLRMYEDENK